MTVNVAAVLDNTVNCAEGKAVDGKAQLEDVAKLANELQPTGSSLATTNVQTKVYLFTDSDIHSSCVAVAMSLLTTCIVQG